MEEIVAPDFGESVFEASVGRWFKQEGESVRAGEPIVELHTDKAVQEINAASDGVVGAILKQIDDVVRPGESLCQFQSDVAAVASVSEPELAIEAQDVEDDDAISLTEVASEPSGAIVEIEENAVEDEGDGLVEINYGPFVESPPTPAPPAAEMESAADSWTLEVVEGDDAVPAESSNVESEDIADTEPESEITAESSDVEDSGAGFLTALTEIDGTESIDDTDAGSDVSETVDVTETDAATDAVDDVLVDIAPESEDDGDASEAIADVDDGESDEVAPELEDEVPESVTEVEIGDAVVDDDEASAEDSPELDDDVEVSEPVDESETVSEDDDSEDIAAEAELEDGPTEPVEEAVIEEAAVEDADYADEVEEAAPAPESAVDQQVSELRQIVVDKPVRRERLSRRRITTARRMAQVQADAVMTTTYNEVDMFDVIRIRQQFGDSFADAHGVKLGFMSFFVKAVLNGLRAFPVLNAELDGDELVYKEYYDIGIAVAGDHGLVVPVVRDADKKTFADIESEIRGFADKARTGSFALEDLVGGTFTITNGGVFGSMMSTPILNPPQVGILGMHNIVDRPMVVDGEIAIRPMMYLAVTYDHRVVEGAQAVQFLMRVKQSLESAEMLMLGN